LQNYQDFLKHKKLTTECSGFDVDIKNLNDNAFDWQKDVIKWALKKGKAALFEDCGLGKTLQQLIWADEVSKYTNKPVLILAPLAVANQTQKEGDKFGILVNICRDQEDVRDGVNITNYDIVHKFDANIFSGIVLDESSILKHHSSKTRAYLTESFKHTPYKLCCTATPAPNDFMELGNHSEFLGIMTMPEMLSTFFLHDGGDTAKWRLKGHAEQKFFEWIASWACCMTSPADLGYDGNDYQLPELNVQEHIVKSHELVDRDGQCLLVASVSQNLMERRQARRGSINDRTQKAADIANAYGGQTLVWCDLNDESALLSRLINNSVEVKGGDNPNHKTNVMMGFSDGSVKCLVSKPSIAGWGMNWQNCDNMIFVGLSDSFESYYQAVRRCWRFGQTKPVNVHIVISDAEGAVKHNIERKQRDAQRMTEELVKYTRSILAADIRSTTKISEGYFAFDNIKLPKWLKEVC